MDRMPPGKNMDDWWTVLRSGMWRLWFQLSAEGRKRYYDEVLPVLHRTKEEVMGDRDDQCYYLVYIGTKPNSQRRGYAAKLLEDMMDKVRSGDKNAFCMLSLSLSLSLFFFLKPKYPRPTTNMRLTAQADAERRPVYLESSSAKNSAYYRKYGFELKKDIEFKRGATPVLLSIMVREPQPRKIAYSSPTKFQLGGLLKV
jgi:GNAT superfamily N-acetyltransferase